MALSREARISGTTKKTRGGRHGVKKPTSSGLLNDIAFALYGKAAYGQVPGTSPLNTAAPRVVTASYKGVDANGQPMYHIRVTAGGQSSYRMITYSKGKVGKPMLVNTSGGPGVTAEQGGAQDDTALQAAKDRWLTTIANSPHSPFHKRNLTRAVENYNGSVKGFNDMMARIFKPTHGPITIEQDPDAMGDFGGFDFDFGGGGGGGGGGGFSGPEYVAPDRRVVEDMVSGMLTTLVGEVNPAMLNSMANLYMSDHRRNFDTPEQEIDPSMSVLEGIRGTAKYQEIHHLRADTEDERSWVGARLQAAQRGGLQTDLRQGFAQGQATIGGDVEDVADAAAIAQVQESGSARGTLIEDKIRGTATAMFQGAVI